MMTLMRQALVGAILPAPDPNIVTTLAANINSPSPVDGRGRGCQNAGAAALPGDAGWRRTVAINYRRRHET